MSPNEQSEHHNFYKQILTKPNSLIMFIISKVNWMCFTQYKTDLEPAQKKGRDGDGEQLVLTCCL